MKILKNTHDNYVGSRSLLVPSKILSSAVGCVCIVTSSAESRGSYIGNTFLRCVVGGISLSAILDQYSLKIQNVPNEGVRDFGGKASLH